VPTPNQIGVQAISGSLSEQVVQLVNYYRAQNGLRELHVDSTLEKSAQSHSDYLATANWLLSKPILSHSFNLTGFKTWGENLSWQPDASDTASRAVSGWIASPGHHANILGNYWYTGVGVSCRGSVWRPDYCYIVQQFGA